jgi:hypothetical protein
VLNKTAFYREPVQLRQQRRTIFHRLGRVGRPTFKKQAVSKSKRDFSVVCMHDQLALDLVLRIFAFRLQQRVQQVQMRCARNRGQYRTC